MPLGIEQILSIALEQTAILLPLRTENTLIVDLEESRKLIEVVANDVLSGKITKLTMAKIDSSRTDNINRDLEITLLNIWHIPEKNKRSLPVRLLIAQIMVCLSLIVESIKDSPRKIRTTQLKNTTLPARVELLLHIIRKTGDTVYSDYLLQWINKYDDRQNKAEKHNIDLI